MRTIWKDTRFELSVEWRDFRYYPRWWLLLSGNRLLISGVVLTGLAFGLWGVVGSGFVPLHEQTPMLYLLFALISGNFTLISIVVSLCQFILTRHLESPGEIREKVHNMITYRQEVSETTRQSVLPVSSSKFFLMLFRSIRQDIRSLEGQDWAIDDEQVRRDLDALVRGLGEHTTYVIELLERSEAGLVFALFTTLSADYEVYLYTVWHLQSEHGDSLSASTNETLERIVTTVEQIDVARRIFKTAFIQSELASLSRRLLYIGLPVLIGLMVLMLLFTAPTATPVSPTFLTIVIPFAVAIGLAPIVVLTAYILRLTTVAGRTATMYPFTTSFDG